MSVEQFYEVRKRRNRLLGLLLLFCVCLIFSLGVLHAYRELQNSKAQEDSISSEPLTSFTTPYAVASDHPL